LFDNINNMSRTQRPAEAAQQISSRLLSLLTDDLNMTLSDASRAMGYATPATLHSVKQGKTLPDAARLAAFAIRFAQETGCEVNLHWLLTGRDGPFLDELRSKRTVSKLDIDIIDRAMKLDVAAKRALLVLLTTRET
jgi:hypothetical protein